jgi:thiamine-monophosphate kinase
VSSSDEFLRIARIRQLLSGTATAGVAIGIGDDAAVLEPMDGSLVISVDASVEHVHFRRAFAGLDVIGERAFTAALSDLAAMGAAPRAALSALMLPDGLSDDELGMLVAGIARAAAGYRCPVVGGNLSRGAELSLTTTVIGEVKGAVIARSGARPGDQIYVSGTLGAAALGLVLLQANSQHGASFVERWRRPRARIAEGQALRGHATAAIDVSDGTLQDLGHLCVASGVGAELRSASLPLDAGFIELAHELGHEPLALALSGGEDYELLYTLAPNTVDPAGGTCIGAITAQAEQIVVRDARGQPQEFKKQGYLHFR